MIALLVAAVLAAPLGGGHANAGNLPVCSNRIINEAVKRAGCTLGDRRCWLRTGGFCMDHVARRVGAAPRDLSLEPVATARVRAGDVAVFSARAHYAYVERVVKGRDGQPAAIEVSEVNHGDCWVDPDTMVTEKYGVVTRRRIAVRDVDGGFARPRR